MIEHTKSRNMPPLVNLPDRDREGTEWCRKGDVLVVVDNDSQAYGERFLVMGRLNGKAILVPIQDDISGTFPGTQQESWTFRKTGFIEI